LNLFNQKEKKTKVKQTKAVNTQETESRRRA